MPKKAVATFFLLAFFGAVLFVFFTFPRTKDQIPTSNNQRPFPSAPEPGNPDKPGGVPVPENVPHPAAPKVPPGPTLRVMAWASGPDARRLSVAADAFGAQTGRQVSLTVAGDPVTYRRDLKQALASDEPPDLCLISSRDFSGLDPAEDLAEVRPVPDTPPRAIAAFTVDGKIKAVPDEFSVEVLFYNPAQFDEAGIAYPDRHWNWDILEADARALESLHLKDPAGKPTYPLEATPSFDLWNILCTEAGHPALDLDTWHLGDDDTKESQMRGLNLIHEVFQELTVTAPPGKPGDPIGHLFAQQRASLLIGPSDLAASLPANFHHGMTFLPKDLVQASIAYVNAWAVPAKSAQGDAALILARYLAARPVHAGWTAMPLPAGADEGSPAAICHAALEQALLPRLDAKTAKFSQFLNQQISLLAYNPQENAETVYARIQVQYQRASHPAIPSGIPLRMGPEPAPKANAQTQLRGL